MIGNKKRPNYLKFIIVVIVSIIIGFGLLTVITKDTADIDNSILGQYDFDLPKASDLTSTNLISFVKKNNIIEPIEYDNSPVLGNPDASIVIYEFSCFGCPSSKSIQPILKEVLDIYPDQIKLVWKDLPIPELYPEADRAHIAGRCAQKQNKFWQYHDSLWENQTNFSIENLKDIGDKIGLNAKQLEKCIENEETKSIINKDVDEASQLLISGTPHFYINSQEIFGTATVEDFEQIINIELNR
jgi:protein-disulfide isomerase